MKKTDIKVGEEYAYRTRSHGLGQRCTVIEFRDVTIGHSWNRRTTTRVLIDLQYGGRRLCQTRDLVWPWSKEQPRVDAYRAAVAQQEIAERNTEIRMKAALELLNDAGIKIDPGPNNLLLRRGQVTVHLNELEQIVSRDLLAMRRCES